MAYLLLTGATGLVGRYVLRNLLRLEVPVATLVRRGRGSSAGERIEAVMDHWEREAGHAQPRPVVLEADLAEPDLALDAGQLRWIASNVGAVLHCAASMTFREDRRGEPFRTNVDGTHHLVDVCRETGIDRLHHVSTAYICGLREGRVLETEVDVGQSMGNVYEQSKLEAEKIIRSADFLQQATFYRPASVVGDSQTGYVTTYHGFYLPLQLAHAMCGQVPVREMNDRFFARLGLRGDEGKNLVPVDWVAEAIAYLVTHPEHHGRTYHLASPAPVPVRDIQRVVRDAMQRYCNRPQAESITDEELGAYENLFHDYMAIYRSHWRDDPRFDLTHTREAMSHLPCPDMGYELLMRVARYPLEHNFGSRRHESIEAEFDVHVHLARMVRRLVPQGVDGSHCEQVGLQVNGRGGGQWKLAMQQGKLVGFDLGLPRGRTPCLYLSSSTIVALAHGRMTVPQSIQRARVVVEREEVDQERAVRALEELVEGFSRMALDSPTSGAAGSRRQEATSRRPVAQR